MVTLKQALSTVNQLPMEEREMLLEIVKNQMTEVYRQQMAEDAKNSIELFHQGKLKPQSIENIIAELDDLSA